MRSAVCVLLGLVAVSTSTAAWSAAVAAPPPAESPAPSLAGPHVDGTAVGSGWRRPLRGRWRVVRGFAPPAQPWLAGHRGVDLAAQTGETVHAAGSGVVGYAGRVAGRGVVAIAHANGLRTTYLPVQASVRPGQRVAAGDVIGVIENVRGHCPLTCLHWGLLRGRRYLDPLLLFGLGQVRLLPLGRQQAQARG